MTQEDKELLLKDICARLPYGVKTCTYIPHIGGGGETIERTLNSITIDKLMGSTLYTNEKPYLRPMSSMTSDEFEEFTDIVEHISIGKLQINIANPEAFDWLNAHHFDYRGLIEKGLAIEAPEGMY